MVLGVFAKKPEPGSVKTRLAAETSADFAARIATAFLDDMLGKLEPWHDDLVLAYAPAAAKAFFADLSRNRFRVEPQGDGDLGQRMERFFARHLGDGRVVLVGTDSPTLPASTIARAFAELERADVVLGPAADGGYYLIGCSRNVPALFQGIPWSSSRVMRKTIDALAATPHQVALLPVWYDVDTLDDWEMLAGHVLAQRLAGLDPGIPATERLVEEFRTDWFRPPRVAELT